MHCLSLAYIIYLPPSCCQSSFHPPSSVPTASLMTHAIPQFHLPCLLPISSSVLLSSLPVPRSYILPYMTTLSCSRPSGFSARQVYSPKSVSTTPSIVNRRVTVLGRSS